MSLELRRAVALILVGGDHALLGDDDAGGGGLDEIIVRALRVARRADDAELASIAGS